MMQDTARRIGPIGTATRAIVGLAVIYIVGGADGLAWDVGSEEVLIGLVALPAASLALGLAARRYADGPLHFTGPLGILVNCAVIVALVANPYTGPGAALFYGVTMLIAAWRGQAGCENTAISNWILRRDDQIGCPVFFPVDAAEARLIGRAARDDRTRTGEV